MALSEEELLYQKIGISLDPDDPVPVDQNYFRILKIPEDTPDEDVRAQAHGASVDRVREAKNYRSRFEPRMLQRFDSLASTAAITLSDPVKLGEHRKALHRKRVDALEKRAQDLQKSGARAEVARGFLEKRAADYGIPKTQIGDTVREILRRVGPWPPDPVPSKPPGGPGPRRPRQPPPASVPRPERMPASVLVGSLAGLLVLAFLWPGLAVFLAVGAAGFGAWLAWRTRDMRVAAWSAGCLLLVVFPNLSGGSGTPAAAPDLQDTAPSGESDGVPGLPDGREPPPEAEPPKVAPQPKFAAPSPGPPPYQPATEGLVLRVDSRAGTIVVSLGWRDRLKVGTILEVLLSRHPVPGLEGETQGHEVSYFCVTEVRPRQATAELAEEQGTVRCVRGDVVQIRADLNLRNIPSASGSAENRSATEPPAKPSRKLPARRKPSRRSSVSPPRGGRGGKPVEPYRPRQEGKVLEVGQEFVTIDLGRRDRLTPDSKLEIELRSIKPMLPRSRGRPAEYFKQEVFVVELEEETAKVRWEGVQTGRIVRGDPVRFVSRGG